MIAKDNHNLDELDTTDDPEVLKTAANRLVTLFDGGEEVKVIRYADEVPNNVNSNSVYNDILWVEAGTALDIVNEIHNKKYDTEYNDEDNVLFNHNGKKYKGNIGGFSFEGMDLECYYVYPFDESKFPNSPISVVPSDVVEKID